MRMPLLNVPWLLVEYCARLSVLPSYVMFVTDQLGPLTSQSFEPGMRETKAQGCAPEAAHCGAWTEMARLKSCG